MHPCSRREFLSAAGMAAAGMYVARPSLAAGAPDGRVAIGRCQEYNQQVETTLGAMFDQLGGLEKLVRGKTVAVKLNMTGGPKMQLNGMPVEVTHWVHPEVIGATVALLGKAGAWRIRLLESVPGSMTSLQEFMASAGWKPQDFVSAARNVEFEDTNYLGNGTSYARMMVPYGGLMYSGFDLNHSYRDCDVFVSLAKLKEHRTAGVTLSMKNCFGLTPATIYAQEAPEDEPNRMPVGYRMAMHLGSRKPPQSAPPAVNLTNHDPGYRVPRIVVDLVSSRPVHLAVIDGVYSMEGGELPNQGPKALHRATHPGVLIAGLNCVSTDAVATAVMGFDPMADRGTPPFETCDNTLRIAEQHGVGTCDLKRIEVVGTSIAKARFPYKTLTQLTRA
ncbi:MAG: DUF362 domain-containing protein [Acidobacteriota bacterium]